jgi:diacylglycerol kinase family enzyme
VKRLHIFNPASGVKHSPELLTKGGAKDEEIYVTTCVGDAERFVYERCLSEPETHFVVYGGDGTINEAVNGIIKSGAGDKALLSVVPAGTGNDFVRSFPEKGKIYTVDAMKYGDRYAVNIVNFGFDSKVVVKTAKYKKTFPGSAAYIAGVVDTFFHKIGEKWSIELEMDDGSTESFNEEFTLALAANCQYYGGGFRAASLASSSDGLLDVVLVKKIPRLAFVNLIGSYKKGTHLDPETNSPYEKFQKYVIFRKCRSIKISGVSRLCADGEIEDRNEAEITVVPAAFRYAT